ncbi:MAG: type III sulfide quinone reductase, selenoprotein subtype [Solirubrobacteraceae bacterium]
MAHRIVILGGGTGGTLAANRLHRAYGDLADIVVIDRDDRHIYEPGLLFIPFEMEEPGGIVRSRRRQLRSGVDLRLGEVDHVDTNAGEVSLVDGAKLAYDVLVIATGAALLPDQTQGLTGPGWGEKVFSFYSLDWAVALREALRDFRRGRLVVNVTDMPIKCPVAPLEVCFLSDWYFHELGVREQIEITYVTSLDGAFTQPACNRALSDLLAEKQIELVTEFNTGQVDGDAGKLVSYDGREVSFELAVVVPLHGGAPFMSRSAGLSDELGFVRTDPHTLQSRVAPNIFVIGDAGDFPTSKAGSAAHFQGDTLTDNIRHFLAGDELEASYDGHVNCFIETGFHKALLIDFNYDTEPLPGLYPDPHIGPLPLLSESRRNHLAKLAFQTLYWHMLLPGHNIPGISAQMPRAGRQTVAAGHGASS